MNPEQMYTLTKLRAAETEERARHARLVAGRRPEPLARVIRVSLRRLAERVRIARPSIPRTDGHDVVADR
jgi:hypothetical protein